MLLIEGSGVVLLLGSVGMEYALDLLLEASLACGSCNIDLFQHWCLVCSLSCHSGLLDHIVMLLNWDCSQRSLRNMLGASKLLNDLHWLVNLSLDDWSILDLSLNDSLDLLSNKLSFLAILLQDLLMLLMNDRFVHLVNDLLMLLMDNWLMDLMYLFLVYDGLMVLVNDVLMMLMHNVLMMLMKDVLMMLMDHISVELFNDWSIGVHLHSSSY